MNKRFFALFILIIMLYSFSAKAGQNSLCNELNNIIECSELNNTAVIALTVKDLDTGKVVYSRNGNKLLHPASNLKAITTPVILSELGENYEVKTGFYKQGNSLYLKLGGDPLLTTEKLSVSVKELKNQDIKTVSNIFIDDSAIDDIPWGVGWMWDDENNPNMPKVSPYNLDGNLVTVKVIPANTNHRPKVFLEPKYNVNIINNAVSVPKCSDVSIGRKPWFDRETIFIEGAVSDVVKKTIPVGSTENYFLQTLQRLLDKAGIKIEGEIKTGKIPDNAQFLTSYKTNMVDQIDNINKNSDNLAVETLFKVMASEVNNETGTTKAGLEILKKYYGNLGVDTSGVAIYDASGVSHNDLITTNFTVEVLSKLATTENFEIYRNSLAQPGEEGTLQNRLLNLKGKLFAKTGTIAGVSGICGYLVSDSGKEYVFSILIQNYKGSSRRAKVLEDNILLKLR